MTRVYNLTSSLGNLANRFHARMLGFSKPATGFLRQPEPRSIGSYQRGLQLKAGNIMFAGHLIEARGRIYGILRHLILVLRTKHMDLAGSMILPR
ncbi:MAG: hypothetical protein VW602_02760 [Paracoccaceae bacterium]